MDQRRTLATLATVSLVTLLTACNGQGAQAPSSPTAPAEPSDARTWPTIQGEAGGTLTVDGKEVGRGNGVTKDFLARMGTPDETTSPPTCGNAPPEAHHPPLGGPEGHHPRPGRRPERVRRHLPRR